jgi:hypothetical protein
MRSVAGSVPKELLQEGLLGRGIIGGIEQTSSGEPERRVGRARPRGRCSLQGGDRAKSVARHAQLNGQGIGTHARLIKRHLEGSPQRRRLAAVNQVTTNHIDSTRRQQW